MNLKGIKKNTAIKYLMRQQSRLEKKVSKQPKKVSTVGILAEEELFRAYDFTKKLSNDLGIDISDIKVMLFQKVKTDKSLDHFEFFSNKSFHMFGKIKDKELKYFLEKKYDILINYCNQDNIYAHIASLESAAKMKASFKTKYTSFYHIAVNIPENKINTFNEEIVKYLKILKLIV